MFRGLETVSNPMKTLLLVSAVVILAAMAWIRLAPIDRDRWHLDPAEADAPGRSGIRFVGLDAPRYPGDPDTVLDTLSDIILSEPRTRLLDGDVDEGMLTFVVRSRIFGFPDFVTVKAVSEGPQSKLSVVSRSFLTNGSDWGVNASRMDRWLQEMRLRLGQG